MALSTGNLASWEDVRTIYNYLNQARDKHGLDNVIIPSGQGTTVSVQDVTTLNNYVISTASEVNATISTVEIPPVGTLITSDVLTAINNNITIIFNKSPTPTFYVDSTLYEPTAEEISSGYQLVLTASATVKFISFNSNKYVLTVCAIGGGGGGGNSYVPSWFWNGYWNGGGGGEGGEVRSTDFTPTENTEYTVTVGAAGTGGGGRGGTTTAFGLTSLGGYGGGSASSGYYNVGGGGSGTDGANGGTGTFSIWTYYWAESHTAGSGGAGTLFNGTWYGGGGGGYSNGGNGSGQGNYGGGGFGSGSAGKSGAVILVITNK